MESTNPKKLRAELADYLALATNEPVRIQRRTGECFILLSEDRYAEMQTELASLRGRLRGMSEALGEQGSIYKPGTRPRAKRTKAR